MEQTIDSRTTTPQGVVLERFKVYSPSMKRHIKAVVALPPAYFEDESKSFPILYTLHGRTAPYDSWADMSNLHAEQRKTPFIYTCFDGDNHSLYIDSYYPLVTARESENDQTKRLSLFATFFHNEFLPAIDSWYRVDQEKRGVTGYSGGGQGAFNYMLDDPKLFTGVSALSSAFRDYRDGNVERPEWIEPKLGKISEFPERYVAMDHFARLTTAAEKQIALPPIYVHCGTEDPLIDVNRRMGKHLKACGYDICYEEAPGAHDWAFWHGAAKEIAAFHWKHFNGY